MLRLLMTESQLHKQLRLCHFYPVLLLFSSCLSITLLLILLNLFYQLQILQNLFFLFVQTLYMLIVLFVAIYLHHILSCTLSCKSVASARIRPRRSLPPRFRRASADCAQRSGVQADGLSRSRSLDYRGEDGVVGQRARSLSRGPWFESQLLLALMYKNVKRRPAT